MPIYREKSRGVFNQSGVLSSEDRKKLRENLRTTKSVIWDCLLLLHQILERNGATIMNRHTTLLNGKSRMEMATKLSELTNRIDNNLDYVSNKKMGELMTEWLLVFKKNQVSPRTFEGVFRNYKLHIEPRISNMKIDEVNNVVIQKVLNSMLEQDYSLTVVKKVKFIFN